MQQKYKEMMILEEQKFNSLRQDLTQQQIDDFRGVFEMFSVDNDEDISIKELSTILRALGRNLLQEEVAKMMEDVDEDNDGLINFFEFCKLMIK